MGTIYYWMNSLHSAISYSSGTGQLASKANCPVNHVSEAIHKDKTNRQCQNYNSYVSLHHKWARQKVDRN